MDLSVVLVAALLTVLVAVPTFVLTVKREKRRKRR